MRLSGDLRKKLQEALEVIKNMILSGSQRKKLLEALNDAFRDKASLERMLAFELDKNLDAIAGGNSLQDIVFNLIKIAEAQGWVEDLVYAALRSNSGNPLLIVIAEELLTIKFLSPHKVSSPNILPEQSTQTQKILILAALPDRLRLDKEIREIEEAIKRAAKRDLFEIKIRTAVRPQDIRRALAEERPQIVHFCGHGQENGSLVLEGDSGNHLALLPIGLAALFKLHTDYVKCVLLNACYSSKSAELIGKHINYVIGMNQPIEDRATIVFAQGFYDGLGYDNVNNLDVIQRAFDEGIVAIQLENLLQVAVPSLWKKVNHQFVSNNIYSTPSIQLISNHQRNNDSIKVAQKSLDKNHVTSDEESELDVDYTALKEFSRQNKFKEADFETTRIMLWIANRLTDQRIFGEDFQYFPPTDLTTIDKIWLNGSNNKFGFSIQKQIWMDKGGNLEKYDYLNFHNFVQELEWEKDNVPCDLRAKKGYLPKGVYYLTRQKTELKPKLREKYLQEYNEFLNNMLIEERNKKIILERELESLKEEMESFGERFKRFGGFGGAVTSGGGRLELEDAVVPDPYLFLFQRLLKV